MCKHEKSFIVKMEHNEVEIFVNLHILMTILLIIELDSRNNLFCNSNIYLAQAWTRKIMTLTEMVLDLIWVPDFFGPQENWSAWKLFYAIFMQGPNFLRLKPQMRSGTISVPVGDYLPLIAQHRSQTNSASQVIHQV